MPYSKHVLDILLAGQARFQACAWNLNLVVPGNASRAVPGKLTLIGPGKLRLIGPGMLRAGGPGSGGG
jgi:hypothetical protein